jgi:hypothetical protein
VYENGVEEGTMKFTLNAEPPVISLAVRAA